MEKHGETSVAEASQSVASQTVIIAIILVELSHCKVPQGLQN
jgi:hypothetical protein